MTSINDYIKSIVDHFKLNTRYNIEQEKIGKQYVITILNDDNSLVGELFFNSEYKKLFERSIANIILNKLPNYKNLQFEYHHSKIIISFDHQLKLRETYIDILPLELKILIGYHIKSKEYFINYSKEFDLYNDENYYKQLITLYVFPGLKFRNSFGINWLQFYLSSRHFKIINESINIFIIDLVSDRILNKEQLLDLFKYLTDKIVFNYRQFLADVSKFFYWKGSRELILIFEYILINNPDVMYSNETFSVYNRWLLEQISKYGSVYALDFMINFLIEKGSDINFNGIYVRTTLFYYAVSKGNIDNMNYFINKMNVTPYWTKQFLENIIHIIYEQTDKEIKKRNLYKVLKFYIDHPKIDIYTDNAKIAVKLIKKIIKESKKYGNIEKENKIVKILYNKIKNNLLEEDKIIIENFLNKKKIKI